MKLLLINPYFNGGAIIPSLGLGFIGTYIKENSDCDVEVIEPALQNITEKDVLEKVMSCDFVGITCYTESRFEVFDFAKQVKTTNPQCTVILGGAHVNSLDKMILEHCLYVDIVVRREGEQSMLDIVSGKPFSTILGITYRHCNTIIQNPDVTFESNIDKFKYDYSLVYDQIKNWKDYEVPKEIQKLNAIPFIASRGCPYRCTFCASHELWDKTFRTLSVPELVSRMKHLVDTYNIGYFRFYDTIFLGNEYKIDEFCKLVKLNNLDISFRIDIKVGTSRKSLQKLRDVGCDVVGFGVESGSDQILKRLNKGIIRAQIEETIQICKDLGFWIIGFFMISLPDETKEDINKTFELLKYFDEINVQFFKVHPNTGFYNELKLLGDITDNVWFESKNDNEFYWCKDNFDNANFYKKEIDLLLQYSTLKHIASHPDALIRRHGRLKGTLLYPISFIIYLIFKSETNRNMMWKLRNMPILKRVYLKLIRG